MAVSRDPSAADSGAKPLPAAVTQQQNKPVRANSAARQPQRLSTRQPADRDSIRRKMAQIFEDDEDTTCDAKNCSELPVSAWTGHALQIKYAGSCLLEASNSTDKKEFCLLRRRSPSVAEGDKQPLDVGTGQAGL